MVQVASIFALDNNKVFNLKMLVMAYDLEKRNGRIARQTANTVFNIGAALIGLALGGTPSTRRSRPSGHRRRRVRRW